MTTEDQIRATLCLDGLPDYMHDGVVRYLVHRIRPGSFLCAVIANDLFRASLTADRDNSRCLDTWARWFYYNAPMGSIGSYDAIDKWCDFNGEPKTEES